jgi:hypothetical protein
MKLNFSILIFIIIHFTSWSQKSIPTDGPCTDTQLFNAKGNWTKAAPFERGTINSAEANKRIDDIHKLLLQIIPQPTGVDAAWHRSTSISYFGSNMKQAHFIKMGYACGFFRYYCSNGNTMSPDIETGTWFGVIANSSGGGSTGDEEWLINGVPVIMQNRVQKTVRGFNILQSEPGSKDVSVLIHRPGISPYIPVTRKQYLEQCILYTTKLHDEVISGMEQIFVRSPEEQEKEKKTKLDKFAKDFANDPKKLKANVDYYLSGFQSDQQIKEEQLNKARKIKADALKKFSDELAKNSRESTLNVQAVIATKYQTDPVFETDPMKGSLLVTENPAYIRKDLPKHVPQFFIVYWTCNDWGSQKKIGEIIEQHFPFEKLQAMIDK